jgi:hypothetical protein
MYTHPGHSIKTLFHLDHCFQNICDKCSKRSTEINNVQIRIIQFIICTLNNNHTCYLHMCHAQSPVVQYNSNCLHSSSCTNRVTANIKSFGHASNIKLFGYTCSHLSVPPMENHWSKMRIDPCPGSFLG